MARIKEQIWIDNIKAKYSHNNWFLNLFNKLKMLWHIYRMHGYFIINGEPTKNLVTIAGRSLVARATLKGERFQFELLCLTNNTDTVSENDNTSDFADVLVDEYHEHTFEVKHNLNTAMLLVALLTKMEANFTAGWKKIGIVASCGRTKALFAEQNIDYDSKNNETNVKVEYTIDIGNGA